MVKRVIVGGALITIGMLKFLKIFSLLFLEDMIAMYIGAEYGVGVYSLFVVVGFALVFWYSRERKWI
jgi:hypothetical protein